MPHELAIYEKLWSDAISAFENGQPQIDPHLSDQTKDLRRGVTLVFRPSPPVRDAVADFIHRLAAICPGQHHYRPEELHVTVLSIISGTELWRREIHRLAACRRVIANVLNAHHPFKFKFHGVTASPGAVLIQGFPADDSLTAIRDHLRDAFARHGLGDLLDRRYKITGAHMTAMRFCKPPADLKPLLFFLKENRDLPFGEMEVNRLQLIFNDWCASADTVRTLQEYQLSVP
jgi:2'-5' RNA ligase